MIGSCLRFWLADGDNERDDFHRISVSRAKIIVIEKSTFLVHIFLEQVSGRRKRVFVFSIVHPREFHVVDAKWRETPLEKYFFLYNSIDAALSQTILALNKQYPIQPGDDEFQKS